jgi:hypothetical protein
MSTRPRGRPFEPGRSGNPGGRPAAIGEFRARARQHAPAAIEELARLALKARSESVRVSAIRELFDRGYGKATSPPVHFELPGLASASDASKAMAAITAAVAAGALTPCEAGELSRLVDVYLKALEVAEIEKRVRALEATHAS